MRLFPELIATEVAKQAFLRRAQEPLGEAGGGACELKLFSAVRNIRDDADYDHDEHVF